MVGGLRGATKCGGSTLEPVFPPILGPALASNFGAGFGTNLTLILAPFGSSLDTNFDPRFGADSETCFSSQI